MATESRTAEQQTALELFKRVLRVRTVSGEGPTTGAYAECAELLRAELAAVRGVDAATAHEFVGGKPVVLATVRGTDAALPSVLFNAHYDVVPASAAHWSVDPWTPTEREGRLYGRGTQDMKCVVAQYVAALARLLRSGFKPVRTAHFSFVPDEEIGGADGMKRFLQSAEFRSRVAPLGLAFDEGLANPGNAFTAFYGERAPMWVILTAGGPTGHGSRFVKDTAIERLLSVSNKALAFRRAEEAVFLGKRASEGCAHCEAKKLGEVTTLNITMLRGGVAMSSEGAPQLFEGEEKVALNVHPTTAKAGMDIRVPPSVPIEDVVRMLDEWCAAEGGNVEWKFAPWTVPPNGHHVTSTDPVANPWWRLFLDAVEKGHGVPVVPEVFPAGTDSRFVRELGVPALGFSPIRNTPVLLHEHDEWIGVDTFLEGVDVYVTLMRAVLSAGHLGGADDDAVRRARGAEDGVVAKRARA